MVLEKSGICPTLRGKVAGSLPDRVDVAEEYVADRLGRLRAAETIRPSVAGACSASHSSVSGRPVKSTSTPTGLPVATSAFNNSCCTSGMPICDRLLLSPLISEASPSAATTTSAFGRRGERLVEQLLVGAAVTRNIARPNIVA